jgi:hypothetical protein
MARRYLGVLIVASALLGLLFPLQASADVITISGLVVHTNGHGDFALWTNQNIGDSQQAIFTQTSGFNGDASDPSKCPTCAPVINFSVNGGAPLAFNDTGKVTVSPVLEQGPAAQTQNESIPWTSLGTQVLPGGETVTVFVAYADNAHASGGILPSPFAVGGDVIAFQGAGGTLPAGAPCSPGTCFDSLAIRIRHDSPVRTPEPASLLLVGSGLIGLSFVAWGRRRRRED